MKNNKGQSTIEFILTFSATVGFIFLFLKMALNYTNGFMAYHATFLASRNYLVHDTQIKPVNDESGRDRSAEESAKAVFVKYFPSFILSSVGAGNVKFNNPNAMSANALTIFVGAIVEFTQPFSIGFIGGAGDVTFRSESFLGREPTAFESYVQTCAAITTVTYGSDCTGIGFVTIDDNGG